MTTKETISDWLVKHGWAIDQKFHDYLFIKTNKSLAILLLREDIATVASFDFGSLGELYSDSDYGYTALLDLILFHDEKFENRKVSMVPYASPQFFDIVTEHAERVK